MNLRKLLPRRITPRDHHPAIFRAGLANIMSGVVEATSLGKMTMGLRMTALNMSSTECQLREFLEYAAQQRPRRYQVRTTSADRIYNTITGAVSVVTGALEVLSGGHLTADWTMLWMCEGEDLIERALERLKAP